METKKNLKSYKKNTKGFMALTKIIWLHVPEIKDYMKPTQNFIEELIVKGYHVIDGITPKEVDNAISKPLIEHWLTENIIIIGQDNVPTLEMIDELMQCEKYLCVNPCLMYEASTALDKVYQNQINNNKLVETYEEPKQVDYGGTGVCKISLEAQKLIDLVNNPCGFPTLDSTIHKLKPESLKWHTHYPMHIHNKISMGNKHW